VPWSRRLRAAACRGWADLLAAAICSERVLAALWLGCAVADLVSAACRSTSQRRPPAVDAAVAGCEGEKALDMRACAHRDRCATPRDTGGRGALGWTPGGCEVEKALGFMVRSADREGSMTRV
jgi:hypothetical protein